MSISFHYDLSYIGPAFPTMEITISSESGQSMDHLAAYIDTGADATIVPLSILKSVKAQRVNTTFARTVTGTRYKVDLYEIMIKIGPYTVYGIDAIANENTDEIILGRDALNQLVVKLDGIAQVTEIHN